MPSLDTIVSEINTRIKAVLGGPVYGLGKYYGISVSVPRNETDGTDYLPNFITNDDENIYVGADDIYPFIIYHKNNGVGTEYDKEKNFGRTPSAMIEISNFQMIVFGDRGILQITPEALYSAIVSGMPITFEKTFTAPLSLRSVNISAVTPNFNSIAVYSQEYKSNLYPLKPNNIFFSISYRITTQYNKNCVVLC